MTEVLVIQKVFGLGLIFNFLLLIHLPQSGYADGNLHPDRISLSYEIGSWQPHSLNDEPRFDTFGAAGATPFSGLAVCIPFIMDYSLRISAGYWSLRDLNEVEKVHSLTLHPVCVDMKYWLIPDNRLSAFVMYGGGVFWGVENETTPLGDKLEEARAGWGINLGAGFDLSVSGPLGIGMTFQYHLVRFKKPLGGVDDFSGPKIVGAVYWYF